MGRAIARLFASEGAALALLDRNEAGRPQGDRRDRHARLWLRCRRQGDGRSASSARRARRWRARRVVNAAGILDITPFADLDPASWDRDDRGQPHRPVQCREGGAAVPAARPSAATIVNIASVSALMPMAGTAGYSASKAGLAMFTKCDRVRSRPAHPRQHHLPRRDQDRDDPLSLGEPRAHRPRRPIASRSSGWASRATLRARRCSSRPRIRVHHRHRTARSMAAFPGGEALTCPIKGQRLSLRDFLRAHAQHVLADLARGHARQIVDQHDMLGELLPGEAGAVEEAADFGAGRSSGPARGMTKAQPFSPVVALGMATIATSATAGWLSSTSSTSLGLMFSPERMMMSFLRPVMTMYGAVVAHDPAEVAHAEEAVGVNAPSLSRRVEHSRRTAPARAR